MNVSVVTERIRSYINGQITRMAADSPIVGFMKPIITRVLENNIYKIEDGLKMIANKDGNIDTEAILTEMLESVMSTKPFTINTSFIGDIEIGEGMVKLSLPVVNKRLVFNTADLQELKNLLTT